MTMSESPSPPLAAEGGPAAGAGRRWTIWHIMAIIAALAPALALARYPFAFGLAAPVGLVALVVALSVRSRRYQPIAWLIILYPAFPLATLYAQWYLIKLGLARRSTPLFGGLIGLSDIGGYLCLVAYVACFSLVVGAAKRMNVDPGVKEAAWKVAMFMPVAWIALFVFAMWDPVGMLNTFFR